MARRPSGAEASAGESQADLARRIEAAIPDAQIRWRYRLVANGMAVVVPSAQLGRLTSLPGVETVYPSASYRPQLDRSPQQIGAPALWGPGLANAGQGIKIAIIDEGIDRTHPFFSPGGLHDARRLPEGADRLHDREGDRRARLPARQPEPGSTPRSRSTPSCPPTAPTSPGSRPGTRTRSPPATRISGVAPRAYLGNYKALTIPTDADVGLDGNSPGARGRDRGGRRGRDGRDQHVARRAGDRALARHRRQGARGRCPGRRRAGGLGRERLRGVRPRLGRLARPRRRARSPSAR